MAKKITSENLHLNIIINGDQSRMELADYFGEDHPGISATVWP
jgi:hypothetical protein